MKTVDLRILILADAKLLPFDVQEAFARWRIWDARNAIVEMVHKRLLDAPALVIPTIQMYLERLELAETEQTILEGIYALAEVIEVYRQYLGLHSAYLLLIMSSHLNPWGLLELQQDFSQPAPSAVRAAEELWRLANDHQVDVKALLAQVRRDDTLNALEAHYIAQATKPASPNDAQV